MTCCDASGRIVARCALRSGTQTAGNSRIARWCAFRSTKDTLENQKMAMEQMNINAEILAAQKAAAKQMQAATQQMGGVDKVEEVMDQVEDGLQDADEIQQAISRSVDVPGMADEDELLAELEELDQDDLAKELGTVDLGSEAVDIPSAPLSLPCADTPESSREVSSVHRTPHSERRAHRRTAALWHAAPPPPPTLPFTTSLPLCDTAERQRERVLHGGRWRRAPHIPIALCCSAHCLASCSGLCFRPRPSRCLPGCRSAGKTKVLTDEERELQELEASMAL